jgi:acetyl-CoA carboxylase carboxyl transferase subunit beta
VAWFKKNRKPIESQEKTSRVPEGLWVKCPSCQRAIYKRDLDAHHQVCDKCGHHFRMTAAERLRLLFDEGAWVEHDAGLRSLDPLEFTDTKPYRARLESSIKATGLNDAIIVGIGHLDAVPCVIAAMEYSFIGGSMGVVVGERITRAAEYALEELALQILQPPVDSLDGVAVLGARVRVGAGLAGVELHDADVAALIVGL